MTQGELRDLLVAAGVSCRVRSSEVLVETCLFCGNSKWNLELAAAKGVYHCWACRSSGRIDQLLFTLTGQQRVIPVNVGVRDRQRQLPLAPIEFKALPISSVPSAEAYLAARGMDALTAAAYGLCVCVDQTHMLHGRIALPARDFWTGATLGWLGRTYVGQRPKYLSTLGSAAVTGWRWASKRAPVVVVEGHMDGIAVHRAGASAAVLSGLATPGIDEWAARVSAAAPIIVMLDGEALEEASRLYWRIVAVRAGAPVGMVRLAPGQDPAGTPAEALRALIGRGAMSSLSSAAGTGNIS